MKRAWGMSGFVLMLSMNTNPWSAAAVNQTKGVDRIIRTYQILEDGHPIGTESWFGNVVADTTVEYRGEIKMTETGAKAYRFSYLVRTSREPRQLIIEADGRGETTRGEYVLSERGVEVRITTASRAPQMRGLNPPAGYYVEFESALSRMLTIERLQLKQGESRSIDVVSIDRTSLDARLVKERYSYRGTEMIELNAHQYDANRYSLQIGSGSRRVSGDLWTDEEYVPLLWRSEREGHTVTVRLASSE